MDGADVSILIVDDEVGMREAIRHCLFELEDDYEVEIVEAEHGRQGLEQLTARKFDLVLLDLMMPVMTGPEMLTELRSRGDATPVLLLTAVYQVSQISPLMRSGVSGYVMKPHDPVKLLAEVQRIVGQKRASADASKWPEDPLPVRRGPEQQDVSVPLLLVDPEPTMSSHLRERLPEHLALFHRGSVGDALGSCGTRPFRVIFFTPDPQQQETSRKQVERLRTHYSEAEMVALLLRDTANPQRVAGSYGCDRFLLKPVDTAELDTLLWRSVGASAFAVINEQVVALGEHLRDEARLELSYDFLAEAIEMVVHDCAARGDNRVVIDTSRLAVGRFMIPLLTVAARACEELGMRLVVADGRDIVRQLHLKPSEHLFDIVSSVRAAVG